MSGVRGMSGSGGGDPGAFFPRTSKRRGGQGVAGVPLGRPGIPRKLEVSGTERRMERERLRLTINGEEREILAPVHHTLLEVLREEAGLTGTKHGCELGECGTCTVLVDSRPVLSCL